MKVNKEFDIVKIIKEIRRVHSQQPGFETIDLDHDIIEEINHHTYILQSFAKNIIQEVKNKEGSNLPDASLHDIFY